MSTKKLSLLILSAALVVPLLGFAAACNRDDDEDDTTADGSDRSSGGEDDDGDYGGLQAPPGSSDPGDPGWDGDDDDGAVAGGGGGGGGAGGSGDSGGGDSGGGGEEPASNPWGETRAEQCKAPPRRAVSSSARGYLDQGLRAAASGDVNSARGAFSQALSADPNAYPAAYNLGVLADRAGNTSQALEQYQRALRMQPDYERAAAGIVTIHLRRGAVPDAISFVQPLARRFGTNLHLQALYAEVLVRANRYDEAWTAARAALRCDERFVPAMIALIKASLGQGRMELADRILAQALQIDDANAELHYLKGTRLMEEAARLREARDEFQRAVQLRPDYAEAHMALGIQLLAGAAYPEALRHFQTAAALAPTLPAAHLNLGDAYRANKQWQQAKASFDKALQMNPNLAQAHFNMGLMYMTAGESFPGLDDLTSLQAAKASFERYRNLMGPRLPREDPSEEYLTQLNRSIDRLVRRRQQAAERAARAAEEG